MRKLFVLSVVALSLTLSATSVMAALPTPTTQGPEVITFKMGPKTLQFQHKKHQVSLKNECTDCHKTVNGKIDNWGKDTAHTLCIPCHDLNDTGPIECHQCHQ